jgi:hypothetical protein
MTKTPFLIVLAVLLLSAANHPCSSAELKLRASNWLEARYNDQADATVFEDRLDLDAEYGRFFVGGRYRIYEPYDIDEYDPARLGEKLSEFSRRFAGVRTGWVTITAGDNNSTFGRGLALSCYENLDIQHDTEIDGAKLEIKKAGASATLIGGVSDYKGAQDLDRTRHGIRGMRAQYLRQGTGYVAVSGVERYWSEDDKDDADGRHRALTGEAEYWGEHLQLAVEITNVDVMDERDGRGAYANLSLYVGGLALSAEYKDYLRIDHPFINPPTAVEEHIWSLLNRSTYQINMDNERGFRGSAMYSPSFSSSFTISASEARRHNHDLSFWEMYLQGDVGELSYLRVLFIAQWMRQYVGELFTEYKSGGLELDISTEAVNSIELTGEYQSVEDPQIGDYYNFLGSLSWSPHPDWSFSFNAEKSDEPLEDEGEWLSGSVKVRFAERHNLEFNFGDFRGGKICVGGVCFVEPGFSGAKLRLLSTF